MTIRSPSILVAATGILWFVPSIGTHGMGTIGQRVAHADAAIFDTVARDRPATEALLARADAVAGTAVGR